MNTLRMDMTAEMNPCVLSPPPPPSRRQVPRRRGAARGMRDEHQRQVSRRQVPPAARLQPVARRHPLPGAPPLPQGRRAHPALRRQHWQRLLEQQRRRQRQHDVEQASQARQTRQGRREAGEQTGSYAIPRASDAKQCPCRWMPAQQHKLAREQVFKQHNTSHGQQMFQPE